MTTTALIGLSPLPREATDQTTPAENAHHFWRISSPCGHLAFDPRRVLLELERVDPELDDLLLAVEGVLPPDGHVGSGVLDHVVTGPRVAAQPQRRDGARVDDEQILEPPRVRHVLVAREDEVHVGSL